MRAAWPHLAQAGSSLQRERVWHNKKQKKQSSFHLSSFLVSFACQLTLHLNTNLQWCVDTIFYYQKWFQDDRKGDNRLWAKGSESEYWFHHDTLWGPDTSPNLNFLTHKMRKFTELNLRPFQCSNSVNLRIAWRPASPSKLPRMMWSLDIRANKSFLNNDFAGRHGGVINLPLPSSQL